MYSCRRRSLSEMTCSYQHTANAYCELLYNNLRQLHVKVKQIGTYTLLSITYLKYKRRIIDDDNDFFTSQLVK